MAFDQQDRNRNENLKFVADSSGNTAVRVKIVDGVQLSPGESFQIKNSLGFVVAEINQNGDLKYKGALIKLK